jgi:hypothetical protein
MPIPFSRLAFEAGGLRKCTKVDGFRGGWGVFGGRDLFAPGFVIMPGPHPHVRRSTLRCGPSMISRHPSKISPAPERLVYNIPARPLYVTRSKLACRCRPPMELGAPPVAYGPLGVGRGSIVKEQRRFPGNRLKRARLPSSLSAYHNDYPVSIRACPFPALLSK